MPIYLVLLFGMIQMEAIITEKDSNIYVYFKGFDKTDL